MEEFTKNTGTCERILECAFDLLSERGYARVTLRDISRRAHVALSQISYYYKNKAGLIAAVAERLTHVVAAEVASYLRRAGGAREWAGALADFARDFVREHPQHLRVMFDLLVQSQWEPEFLLKVRRVAERFGESAGELLGDAWQHCPRAAAERVLGALLDSSVASMLGGWDALPSGGQS